MSQRPWQIRGRVKSRRLARSALGVFSEGLQQPSHFQITPTRVHVVLRCSLVVRESPKPPGQRVQNCKWLLGMKVGVEITVKVVATLGWAAGAARRWLRPEAGTRISARFRQETAPPTAATLAPVNSGREVATCFAAVDHRESLRDSVLGHGAATKTSLEQAIGPRRVNGSDPRHRIFFCSRLGRWSWIGRTFCTPEWHTAQSRLFFLSWSRGIS